MERLRLTLVVHSLYGGGAERVAATLANCWSKAGNDVTVITFEPEGDVNSYVLNHGIQVRRLGLSAPSPNKFVALWMLVKRVRILRRAIRQSGPDAVISFVSESNVLAILACLRTSIPVIASEHCHPDFFRLGREWEVLRRVVYPLASSLVSVSKGVHDWFSWLNIPQYVIYNPTALFEVEPRFGENDAPRKTLVAAGRLTYQKGFDILIRSFGSIADRFQDWDVVIYGEGPDRSLLEQLVRNFGLEERIKLPGVVDNLSAHLVQGDLFVMPSRFEGFGNVLVEAMNVGLPVISFDCMSGPSEIITHGKSGLLVPEMNEEALAEAMSVLMGDRVRRRAMGEMAFGESRRFAEEPVIDKWNEVVRAIRGRS